MTLKLAIFDVDGTLVDSQADIVDSMSHGFAAAGQGAPVREAVLGVVGLALPVAVATLAPDLPEGDRAAIVEGYKARYQALRKAQVAPVFYPGTRALLDRLHAQDDWLLGIATGKSRRGIEALMDQTGLRARFVTLQCSDDHPSKPHPAMLLAALAETGVAAADAVMVGDTSFDMEMARDAGIAGIGVSWGYHDRSRLGAARHMIDTWDGLPPLLERLWGTA